MADWDVAGSYLTASPAARTPSQPISRRHIQEEIPHQSAPRADEVAGAFPRTLDRPLFALAGRPLRRSPALISRALGRALRRYCCTVTHYYFPASFAPVFTTTTSNIIVTTPAAAFTPTRSDSSPAPIATPAMIAPNPTNY
ncbi:hypothetical protein AG0111_0g11046 [Alternaria gaisen]|uniref:Uncharacterized protein n=1 Tax=Alternaria gaisen TaxID=167740 RepID=A0ACB6F9L7_9PLEO|nr:hypothetical protein AG0111_0g11046 [Alternaria gaisen]